jgi:hypothetical protein
MDLKIYQFNCAIDGDGARAMLSGTMPARICWHRASARWLVANPAMSDQPIRAALMERVGAVRVLPASELSPQLLAQKLRIVLSAPAPAAKLALNGAHRTATLLESLANRGDFG